MRADDGCIDHLQSRVTHSASSECLQDHIPQAAVGPPTELTKDRIPVAKFLRQIAPGRAGSHQPKHRVEHAAMIARWSATTPYQERLEIRPLIVGHQSANHGRSPQRAALNQFAIPASIDLSTRPRLRVHSLARNRPTHPAAPPTRPSPQGRERCVPAHGGEPRSEAVTQRGPGPERPPQVHFAKRIRRITGR